MEDAAPLGLSLGDCKTLVGAETEATAAGETVEAEAATAVFVFVIAAAAGTAGTVGTTTN